MRTNQPLLTATVFLLLTTALPLRPPSNSLSTASDHTKFISSTLQSESDYVSFTAHDRPDPIPRRHAHRGFLREGGENQTRGVKWVLPFGPGEGVLGRVPQMGVYGDGGRGHARDWAGGRRHSNKDEEEEDEETEEGGKRKWEGDEDYPPKDKDKEVSYKSSDGYDSKSAAKGATDPPSEPSPKHKPLPTSDREDEPPTSSGKSKSPPSTSASSYATEDPAPPSKSSSREPSSPESKPAPPTPSTSQSLSTAQIASISDDPFAAPPGSSPGTAEEDCEALSQLFADMNGPAWAVSTGWEMPAGGGGGVFDGGGGVDYTTPDDEEGTPQYSEGPVEDPKAATVSSLNKSNRYTRRSKHQKEGEDEKVLEETPTAGTDEPEGTGGGGVCCDWYGVTCDKEGRVEGLNLAGNGLVGGLSERVFDLGGLVKLNLSSNAITNVSDSFTSLPSLRHIYLASNNLTGPIPQSLQQSPSLVNINLAQNAFTGDVQFASAGITNLALDYNKLTSVSFPVLVGGGEMGNLTRVGLSGNEFGGPLPDLSGAKGLQILDAADNHFSGPLFNLYGLHNLTKLDVRNNALSGPFPPTFSQNPNLLTLLLSRNQFSSVFPSEKAPPQLTNCQVLPNPMQGCPSQQSLMDPDSLATKCRVVCQNLVSAATAPGQVGAGVVDIPVQSIADPGTAQGIPNSTAYNSLVVMGQGQPMQDNRQQPRLLQMVSAGERRWGIWVGGALVVFSNILLFV